MTTLFLFIPGTSGILSCQHRCQCVLNIIQQYVCLFHGGPDSHSSIEVLFIAGEHWGQDAKYDTDWCGTASFIALPVMELN